MDAIEDCIYDLRDFVVTEILVESDDLSNLIRQRVVTSFVNVAVENVKNLHHALFGVGAPLDNNKLDNMMEWGETLAIVVGWFMELYPKMKTLLGEGRDVDGWTNKLYTPESIARIARELVIKIINNENLGIVDDDKRNVK